MRPFQIEDRVLPHVPFNCLHPDHSVKANHHSVIVALNVKPGTAEVYHAVQNNETKSIFHIEEKYLVLTPILLRVTDGKIRKIS